MISEEVIRSVFHTGYNPCLLSTKKCHTYRQALLKWRLEYPQKEGLVSRCQQCFHSKGLVVGTFILYPFVLEGVLIVLAVSNRFACFYIDRSCSKKKAKKLFLASYQLLTGKSFPSLLKGWSSLISISLKRRNER